MDETSGAGREGSAAGACVKGSDRFRPFRLAGEGCFHALGGACCRGLGEQGGLSKVLLTATRSSWMLVTTHLD